MADTALLNKFHALEISICSYENKHIESQYHVSDQQLHKLEAQYEEMKQKYARVHAELDKQKGKDAKYNAKGPNFKKFGARITGHLKDKQAEKHELVAELQKKDEKYQHDFEYVKSQLQSHRRRHKDLEHDQAQLITWRHEQEDILHQVFDGPTGSPEENAVEMEVMQIQQQKHDIGAHKAKYETCRQHLAGAVKQLAGAHQNLGAAQANNRLQMAGGLMNGPERTPMMNIMEQRRIQHGKMLLEEAKQNLINAKALVPEIPRIQDSDIQAFGLLFDMAFGGVVGDMMQARKLRESLARLEGTLQSTQYALTWIDAKIAQEINPQIQGIEKAYFAKRDQLKQMRYALIRAMIPSGQAEAVVPTPPTYAPVSSEDAFVQPTCWTTGNVTPQETQARQLVNSNSFNLFGQDSGSDHEIHQWLNSLAEGLGALYGPALIEYGYDSMTALKAADDEEFSTALGELELNGQPVKVKKPHQRLMTKAHSEMH